MTGAIATLLIVMDLIMFTGIAMPDMTIASAAVWIAIAYFVGHLLQMMTNVIRDIRIIPMLNWETHQKFMSHETQLLDHARTIFKAEHLQIEQLWNLCYMFAASKDTTNQVEAFSAYYNLYRGWFMAFFMQTAIFLFAFTLTLESEGLDLSFVSLAITLLLYRRTKLFFQYLRDKVFGIFTIATTVQPDKN